MALSTHTSDDRSQGHDRRPCLLVCNWSKTDPVWDLVEDLSGVPWQAEGSRTELVEPQEDVVELAASLSQRLLDQEARALLLIGRTRHEGPARIQLRTEIPLENGERISQEGPGIVRSTAPAAQIAEALTKSRVAVISSSENEADAGSRLLYEIMTRMDDKLENTPAIALMRFPANMPESMIAEAVKGAANVLTQNLTPTPRFAVTR